MDPHRLQQAIEKRAGSMSLQRREGLPSKQFAVPAKKAKSLGVSGEIQGEAKGKYPIPDKKHARNALARVSQFGSPGERQAVRSKVYSKYPELREGFEQRHGQSPTSGKNIKKVEQGGVGGPAEKRAGMAQRIFGSPPPAAQRQLEALARKRGKKVEDLRGSDFPTLPGRVRAATLKESAGCKKAALDLSAQRGAALAKAAMADPDFREAAQMMSKEGSFWKNVAVGTAGLALAPVAYGVGQMGVGAVQKAYQSLTEGKQKAKAYSEMMKVHKGQLGSEDKSKIQTAFNSLWGLNPDLAKDPLVSGTYVTKAIDYGGVTTQEANQLIQARKGMGEARSREEWMPDSKAVNTAAQSFSHASDMAK